MNTELYGFMVTTEHAARLTAAAKRAAVVRNLPDEAAASPVARRRRLSGRFALGYRQGRRPAAVASAG